jgi:DNA-directed RNA polymerase subunit RPC12/RpoP
MAIKILKQGTKKKAECPECGSLLSYDASEDVETGNEKRYGNGELYNRRYEYITCPCCKQRIVLEVDR